MSDFLAGPLAAIVLLVALTAALVAIGAYVISKVRASYREEQTSASDWMTSFKEIHSQGELTDQEYRTIKAMLAERLQHEIKDTDNRH